MIGRRGALLIGLIVAWAALWLAAAMPVGHASPSAASTTFATREAGAGPSRLTAPDPARHGHGLQIAALAEGADEPDDDDATERGVAPGSRLPGRALAEARRPPAAPHDGRRIPRATGPPPA